MIAFQKGRFGAKQSYSVSTVFEGPRQLFVRGGIPCHFDGLSIGCNGGPCGLERNKLLPLQESPPLALVESLDCGRDLRYDEPSNGVDHNFLPRRQHEPCVFYPYESGNSQRAGQDDGVGSCTGILQHKGLQPSPFESEQLLRSKCFHHHNRGLAQLDGSWLKILTINLLEQLQANLLDVQRPLADVLAVGTPQKIDEEF